MIRTGLLGNVAICLTDADKARNQGFQTISFSKIICLLPLKSSKFGFFDVHMNGQSYQLETHQIRRSKVGNATIFNL